MKTLLILITSILLFNCNTKFDTKIKEEKEDKILNNRAYSIIEEQNHTYICYAETIIHNEACKCKNNDSRSYQIELIEDDYILLYDKDKLIGRFKSSRSLDSLITKDNQ